MQRTVLFLTLLMVLGAATPFAAAQGQFEQTTTELSLISSSEPAAPGDQMLLKGKVEYTYPANGQLELAGTQITFKVAGKPDWATVVVNPTSLVMPVNGADPALTVTRAANIQVQVHVDDSAPLGESGVVTIQAIASQNGQLKGSTGESSILVATVSDAPCTAGSTTDEVSIQGITATPAGFLGLAPAQMAAVLGIGATAGAAGIVMGRRFGRA